MKKFIVAVFTICILSVPCLAGDIEIPGRTGDLEIPGVLASLALDALNIILKL